MQHSDTRMQGAGRNIFRHASAEVILPSDAVKNYPLEKVHEAIQEYNKVGGGRKVRNHLQLNLRHLAMFARQFHCTELVSCKASLWMQSSLWRSLLTVWCTSRVLRPVGRGPGDGCVF